jgi:nucleoside phosphorylase
VEASGVLAKLQTIQGREQLSHNVSRHLDALQQQLGFMAAHPGRSEDKLFHPEYLHKHHDPSDCASQVSAKSEDSVCDQAFEKSCDTLKCSQQASNLVSRLRPEQRLQPVVHFGLVASGDKVVRSGGDRDDIARRDGVIAFEMEGAGMWEELRHASCLVVKSICDYADSHKNKLFQGYAAAVAAATAKALLQSWDARK